MVKSVQTGKPLARYAAARRIGDLVFMSGVVAVDASSRRVISDFESLPPKVRKQLGATGEMSVDALQAPILVQSWWVLDHIRQLAEQHGGSMADVFKLVQYFTDLRDYPLYSGVRNMFYPGQPPASTVVQVSAMLPSREVRIEVEATACIPLTR